MTIYKQIKQRLANFFGSRMPKGQTITLNQKSTYIWPSRTGYLIIGIVILMMIGATNYQNNLAFLLTFLLIGIGLVSIIFTFKNLQGIQFTFLKNEEVFAGQSIPVRIGLSSHDNKQHYSIGVGWDKKALNYVDVKAQGFSHVSVELTTQKRGLIELPRIVTSSQFPFGWLITWAYFGADKPLLVYPTPMEPGALDRHESGQESDEGLRQEGNEDLYGLKPYQKGEPLTRVDWKAYARGRGMFIREFASYQSQQLCFNWHDFLGVSDEQRLSFLTYLVIDAASQNLNYSLVLPEYSIDFGDGENHRKKCLNALALYGVEASVREELGYEF